MFSEDKYMKVADFFKILGDSTRCKIVSALSMNEMCVGDLANVLSMTKSSISHQLSKMKEAGVVISRRNGKEIYYSLDDDHVAEIFELTIEHILILGQTWSLPGILILFKGRKNIKENGYIIH